MNKSTFEQLLAGEVSALSLINEPLESPMELADRVVRGKIKLTQQQMRMLIGNCSAEGEAERGAWEMARY
jgi:hypothetical protein